MDMTKEYGDGANPVILKAEVIMSLCEQLIGGSNLGAKQKSIIDRCTASVYLTYQQNNYQGEVPTLQDFRAELLKQDEPEAVSYTHLFVPAESPAEVYRTGKTVRRPLLRSA